MHIEIYVREGERIVRNVVFIKVHPYNFNFKRFSKNFIENAHNCDVDRNNTTLTTSISNTEFY